MQNVLERFCIFTLLYWCIFLCYFSTVHTGVGFDYMFFNVYSFTKFIIFVTAPCLFTNTMLLEHAYLCQRTVHRVLLAFVSLLPCTLRFHVIHRLLSSHISPACGVVASRQCTIGDGFIQHKTINTEWWFVNLTDVYHRGGGFNTGFPSLQCETCGTLQL